MLLEYPGFSTSTRYELSRRKRTVAGVVTTRFCSSRKRGPRSQAIGEMVAVAPGGDDSMRTSWNIPCSTVAVHPLPARASPAHSAIRFMPLSFIPGGRAVLVRPVASSRDARPATEMASDDGPYAVPRVRSYFFPRTVSLKVLATENPTFLRAGILIASPVCGLRPMRAFILRRRKIPSPGIFTFSPFFTLLTMVSTRLSMSSSTCLRLTPPASASFVTNCDLVIPAPPFVGQKVGKDAANLTAGPWRVSRKPAGIKDERAVGELADSRERMPVLLRRSRREIAAVRIAADVDSGAPVAPRLQMCQVS